MFWTAPPGSAKDPRAWKVPTRGLGAAIVALFLAAHLSVSLGAAQPVEEDGAKAQSLTEVSLALAVILDQDSPDISGFLDNLRDYAERGYVLSDWMGRLVEIVPDPEGDPVATPVQVSVGSAAGQVKVMVQSASGTRVAQVGDIDGDGRADLVTAEPSKEGVGAALAVLFGDQGEFTRLTGPSFGPPLDLSARDVNGDGLPEIAILGRDPDGNLVLTFGQLDPFGGTLDPLSQVPVAPGPGGVALTPAGPFGHPGPGAVLATPEGVRIFDITDPTNPQLVRDTSFAPLGDTNPFGPGPFFLQIQAEGGLDVINPSSHGAINVRLDPMGNLVSAEMTPFPPLGPRIITSPDGRLWVSWESTDGGQTFAERTGLPGQTFFTPPPPVLITAPTGDPALPPQTQPPPAPTTQQPTQSPRLCEGIELQSQTRNPGTNQAETSFEVVCPDPAQNVNLRVWNYDWAIKVGSGCSPSNFAQSSQDQWKALNKHGRCNIRDLRNLNDQDQFLALEDPTEVTDNTDLSALALFQFNPFPWPQISGQWLDPGEVEVVIRDSDGTRLKAALPAANQDGNVRKARAN